MLYIDTNMVRAGVVKHPKDWPYCGYQEIINYKQKYTLINRKKLIQAIEIQGEVLENTYHSFLPLKNRNKGKKHPLK